jgi:hypothetical protein
VIVAPFRVAALFATCLLVALAACSNTEAAEPDEAEATAPDPQATNTPAPEEITDPFEAAAAAYVRFHDVLDEAAAIPDPNYPPLDEVAAGRGLEAARSALESLADQGLRNTGKHTFEFEVKDWAPADQPTEVALIVCSDSSDTLIVDVSTGEAAEGEDYGKRRIEALVELREGSWIVTDLAVGAMGSC